MGGPNTHGDSEGYFREQAALVESLRNRNRSDPGARRAREWAGKTGPAAYVRGFVNRWNRGAESPLSTIDSQASTDGLLIAREGEYEIVAMQRGNGTDAAAAFVNIAVDGDRDVLRQNPGGLWTFDHSIGERAFSTARYMGPVAAGSLITVGPSSTAGRDALIYSATDYDGSVFIRRIS